MGQSDAKTYTRKLSPTLSRSAMMLLGVMQMNKPSALIVIVVLTLSFTSLSASTSMLDTISRKDPYIIELTLGAQKDAMPNIG
jgi:hypothetical protein